MNESKNSFANLRRLFKNSFRIMKMAWNEIPGLFSAMIFLTIIMGIIPVFATRSMGNLIDKIIEAHKLESIEIVYPTLALFALLTIAPSVVRIFIDYLDRHLQLRIQDFFELYTLKKRGEFDISQYEDSAFQDRIQRAFNNGSFPLLNILETQIGSLEAITGIIAGGIFAAVIDWRVFLLVILTSIPDFIVNIKYGGRIWGIWNKRTTEQRRYYDLRRFFTNRYSIIDGKLNQVSEKFLSQIRKILTDFSDEQLSTEHWKTGMKVLTSFISLSGLCFGTLLIIKQSLTGAVAVGTIVFMFQTLNRISGWTGNVLSYISRMLERNLYVTDILSIYDEKPVLKEPAKPKHISLLDAPNILFENVSFRYPGQEKWALQNINLEIKPGQKIGLVGDNGSGKSTLVRLLLRIHDPSEGRVTVNGIDLRDLKIADWWRYLGVLLQDYTSYDFQVREAIGVSETGESIDEEKMLSAAKGSTSDTFIENFAKKYDEQIGIEFGGIEPSKGQRQKLAIARALYKSKRLLILDEPTASIDALSAAEIFAYIENLPKDKSAVLISHNFATIKRADTIFVLKNGEVVERGTHEELLALSGNYAEAFAKQKKDFE